jgi:hypothetical protein
MSEEIKMLSGCTGNSQSAKDSFSLMNSIHSEHHQDESTDGEEDTDDEQSKK